jgi:hypothetical protein
MVNAWVEHVKRFARDNNISYMCAISKEECKTSYRRKNQPTEPPETRTFRKKRVPPPPPKILLIKDAPPKKVRRTWAEGYEQKAMAKNDTKRPPMQRITKAYSKMITKAVGTGNLSKRELNSLGLD